MANFSYYESNQDNTTHNLITPAGPTNYPAHFHKKTEITYMIEGNCQTIINNTPYFAEKDDIVFVSAYYPHSYKTSENAKRFILCPTDRITNDFSSLVDKKIFRFLLTNKTFNKEKILPVLKTLFEIHESTSYSQNTKWLISKGYLNIFYGYLLECYHDCLIERSNQIEMLSQILNYIDEHSEEKLTLDSLSKQFGYNKYHFSKLFNSSVGQNLNNYINGIRIKKFTHEYSKKQDCNIMNLAFNLGFDSMPSFYRAFKSFYGCTPSEYFTHSNDKKK